MTKDGNGDDKSVENVKKQMEFLKKVRALADQYGIKTGIGQGAPAPVTGPRKLRVQVREKDNQVFIDFGQQIAWLGIDIEQATKLAASIIKIVQVIQKDQSIEATSGDPEHYADLVDGGKAEPPETEPETEPDLKDVDKPE